MDLFTGKKQWSLQLGLFSLVFFLACSRGIPNNTLPVQAPAQQPEAKSDKNQDSSYPKIGLIVTDPEASEIWRRFTKNGRFRIPSRTESGLSEKNYRPYGDGDFNGDDEYDDFAVVVVDTVKVGTPKFGVVVFTTRNGHPAYEGPFWLYLKPYSFRISLNTSSHGPLKVAQHNDDGTIIRVCIVRWNNLRKRFLCDSRA